MIELIENSRKLIHKELEIMNSNPQYNLWASDKTTLEEADILKEHEESERLGSTRWLVQNEHDLIGVIDYLPENKRDGMPWIGLFVIHNGFHGKGIAQTAYEVLEKKLSEFGHDEIHLAILKKNTPGIRFWQKQGYTKYSDAVHEGREIEKWRKKLK